MSGGWPEVPSPWTHALWTTVACRPCQSLGASTCHHARSRLPHPHTQECESDPAISFSNQKGGGLPHHRVASLGRAERCGWGAGRRQQVGEAGPRLLPAQPGAPRGEQRPQSGGQGWAGCGPPWRAPGTSRWLPVPVPGPRRVCPGLGAGQTGRPNGGPHGLLRPVTQPHTRPPQGRQWWLVVLGGPPGRCEPQGGLGLSFLLWTTSLITQV